ncbi:MAG: adenosylcobinamide-GDP ribazoletransferase [Propioniciclava sp.]
MTAPRPPSGLRAALGLFTVIGVRPFTVDADVAARAVRWLPVVGAGLGLLAGLSAIAVSLAVEGPLGAVIGVLALSAVTGGLHLDGLADTADGLGSRKPPADALTVMRRSDIGPMGVISIVGVLLIDSAALAPLGIGPLALALLTGPAVGRAAVWWATRPAIPGARGDGFGAAFVGATSARAARIRTALLLTALAALAWFMASLGGASSRSAAATAVIAVGLAVAALSVGGLWRRHLLRRLGGLTGDTYGSVIEITQAAYWVGWALVLGAR